MVRFRVEDELWHDATPEKPDVVKQLAEGVRRTEEEELKKRVLERPVPYAIVGSMGAPGLGCVYWWRDQDEAAGEEEGDAEGGADVEMDDE